MYWQWFCQQYQPLCCLWSHLSHSIDTGLSYWSKRSESLNNERCRHWRKSQKLNRSSLPSQFSVSNWLSLRYCLKSTAQILGLEIQWFIKHIKDICCCFSIATSSFLVINEMTPTKQHSPFWTVMRVLALWPHWESSDSLNYKYSQVNFWLKVHIIAFIFKQF